MTSTMRPGPPLRVSAPQLTPSVRRFLADEAGGGAALLVAAVVALLWSNSPWSASYEAVWSTPTALAIGPVGVELDLHHVVNDAAMALFFLVIGLEVSREATVGALRDRRTVLVPALGALGGLAVPIALYLAVNPSGEAARGWGIVMSTDTAFVLGVLALFGPRCPDQLRLFLLTLAVADDIGAVALLAVFYTDDLRLGPLFVALALAVVLVGLRWLGVWRVTPYVLVGVALWFAVYGSGVHPTLAGVVLGLIVPVRPAPSDQVGRLRAFGRALVEDPTADRAAGASLAVAATVPAGERLGRSLHPWSAYVVVPAFGLANAGVPLGADALRDAASSPVTLGVVLALVLGNTIGITGAAVLALRTGLGVLPGRVRYGHLLGGAVLAGMGFTISLFVADLAFDEGALRDQATIGVLAGSALAGVLGAVVIRVVGDRLSLCSPGTDTPSALPPLPWGPPATTS